MLILGDKYTLTKLEEQKISKKFNIEYIYTKSLTTKEIIKIVSNRLNNKHYKIVVLNMEEEVSIELIQFLTSLELRGIKLLTIESFLEQFLGKVYIPKKDKKNISYLSNLKQFNKFQYFQKRSIDFIILIPLIFFSIPLIIYSVYRIKKESPEGPIIFKQIRVSKNAKPFICYKFRSMRTDVNFFNPYTQENDPRIFPWGKFMRKTRIDELPQLWNVIKGDLHIIGPRAEWDELVKKYEKIWPYYHLRHLNAPGITGWAQVNYPYGKDIEDTRQKLMYDLFYIKNWSLWLEIKTIFKTILIIFNKKGL